jgi:hypothetical protein
MPPLPCPQPGFLTARCHHLAEKSVAEQSTRDEEFVNSLNARISTMGSVRESMEETEPSALDSFEDASDQDLAKGFSNRLEEVAASALGPREHLTGYHFVEVGRGKLLDMTAMQLSSYLPI